MPHLALDTTYTPTDEERRAITAGLTELYTEEMRTSAGHVAVTLRTHPESGMTIGRAVEGPLAFLDADVRRGRPFERRRAFALAFVDLMTGEWDVPRQNVKVVFTEHSGSDLMGADRVGDEWENPD